MEIGLAGPEDVPELARLLWLNADKDQRAQQTVEAFAMNLAAWWADHRSYVAVLAREGGVAVGMAWVALVPRVPRPGVIHRFTGDIQSVFVSPEHRGQGIGSSIVLAATEHAEGVGAGRVTVHSGRRALPIYHAATETRSSPKTWVRGRSTMHERVSPTIRAEGHSPSSTPSTPDHRGSAAAV